MNGRMPRSVSSDMGRNWAVSESPFDPITGGQRSTIQRIGDDALMFVSFTPGARFIDDAGVEFEGRGMFAAVSFDEGETWPLRKLVSDNGPERTLNGGAWTRDFTMSKYSAEPKGYLTSYPGADGTIHLISSMLHYRFSKSWLIGKRA